MKLCMAWQLIIQRKFQWQLCGGIDGYQCIGIGSSNIHHSSAGVLTNMGFNEAVEGRRKKKIKLMRAHCSYTIRKMKLQGNKVLCFSMMAYNIYGREYFTILIDGGDSMMLKWFFHKWVVCWLRLFPCKRLQKIKDGY